MALDLLSHADFPSELSRIPEHAITREAFGLTPAFWAIALIGLPAVVFVQPAKPSAAEYITCCGIMLLGVWLGWYELRRRKRQRALVRFGRDANLAVYSGGQLTHVVSVVDLELVLRDSKHTWGALLAVIFGTIAMIGMVGIALVRGLAFDRATWWLMITGSVCFPVLLWSLLWTRFFCEEIRYPSGRKRGIYRMLVRKAEIAKLFSR